MALTSVRYPAGFQQISCTTALKTSGIAGGPGLEDASTATRAACVNALRPFVAGITDAGAKVGTGGQNVPPARASGEKFVVGALEVIVTAVGESDFRRDGADVTTVVAYRLVKDAAGTVVVDLPARKHDGLLAGRNTVSGELLLIASGSKGRGGER